jgi:hypothetical protein
MGTRARAAFLLLKKELLALACIGLEAFFIHFLPTRRVAGRPCGGAGAVGARLGVHFHDQKRLLARRSKREQLFI